MDPEQTGKRQRQSRRQDRSNSRPWDSAGLVEDCLIGHIIEIGSWRLVIEAEYWRTKTSFNQRLVPWSDLDEYEGRISSKSRFLVGRSGERRYWVKELLGPPRRGGGDYEANRMERYGGLLEWQGIRIGPVQLHVHDATRLVMDHLVGYLTISRFAKPEKVRRIADVVYWWLGQTGIPSYDLSPNNIMVRWRRKGIDVRLIDFAWSPMRDSHFWSNKLQQWVDDARRRYRRRQRRKK